MLYWNILLLFFCTSLYATVYHYHPQSKLSLGKGFDSFNQDKIIFDCFQLGKSVRERPNMPIVSSEMKMKIIENSSDYLKEMAFSSALEGRYLFLQGKGDFSFLNTEQIQSDSLSWVISFEVNFGYYRNDKIELKKEWKKRSLDEIVAKCGREVVVREKRAFVAYLFVTASHLKQKEKRELKEKFNFHVKDVGWKGKLEEKYHLLIQSLKSSDNISLHFHTIGGKSSFPDIMNNRLYNNNHNYLDLPKMVAKYMKGVTVKESGVIESTTAPIEAFISNSNSTSSFSTLPPFPQNIVESLFGYMVKYQNILKRIEFTLENPKKYKLNKKVIDRLTVKRGEYQLALNQIRQRGLHCFNPQELSDCREWEETLLPAKWPPRREAEDEFVCSYCGGRIDRVCRVKDYDDVGRCSACIRCVEINYQITGSGPNNLAKRSRAKAEEMRSCICG